MIRNVEFPCSEDQSEDSIRGLISLFDFADSRRDEPITSQAEQ